MSIAGAGGIGF